MLEIIVAGEPVAKKRPRFARRGNFVTTYSDQKSEEEKFIRQVLCQTQGREMLNMPLSVDLFFFRSRPKSHYGTGSNSGQLKNHAPELPIVKPDVDNYIKFVLDCLNKIVWKDDALVVSISASKLYAKEPKTIIKIRGFTNVKR